MSAGLDLRERTRRAVRTELMSVAMDLFVRNGYEATTIDEIVAAAGMSRRSFFRYFGSKEDVVLGHLDALGASLAEALGQRPANEDAWTALRRAFDTLIAHQTSDPQAALSMRQMLDGNPGLQARNLERQCRWHDRLAPQIAARLSYTGTGPADDSPAGAGAVVDSHPGDSHPGDSHPGAGPAAGARTAAVIGAALACMEAANRAWMATDGRTPLATILDDVMRTVRPAAF
ncbi:helix-turn-helix domain-containing protein [Parafrankia sp. EAN1pec]|uniref:TetR/AcrR family transcriptional regulator n=1 Tax=Parafrankia sp. (strain EAN1pec) TaxID=298653 RepID=UPI00269F9616